jgi:hypothetical protein
VTTALVIEDGTNVAGANTYCDVTTIRAFANARGATLPETDDELIPLVFGAMDYIEAKRNQFQGKKTNWPGDDLSKPIPQPLQWPRNCVTIDGDDFPNNAIPLELKNALCQLCVEQASGIDISPTQTGPFVISEKIDVIETKYSETVRTSGAEMPRVDAFLAPLLKQDSGFALSTVRV